MKSKRRKSWILFFSGGPVPSFYDAVTGDVLPLWRSPWVSESHRDDEDDEGNIPFFHSFFLSFSFFLLLLPLRLWLAATGPVDLIKKIPGIFSWRSSSGGLSFSDTAGNDRTSARRPGVLLSFFFFYWATNLSEWPHGRAVGPIHFDWWPGWLPDHNGLWITTRSAGGHFSTAAVTGEKINEKINRRPDRKGSGMRGTACQSAHCKIVGIGAINFLSK